ncbi:MAG: response regulator [Nanoarchaeota archaeon]
MKLDVLVIEDANPCHIKQKLDQMLGGDVRIDVIDSGEEAIKKAKEKEYDLAVIDFNMGCMNGLQTARELKVIIPKLKMIGYSSSWSQSNASEAGLEFYHRDLYNIGIYIQEKVLTK